MIPVFSRKSVLLLILGVFALLFGMIQTASAVTCSAFDPSFAGEPNPSWQKAGDPSIDNCTVTFADPVGGSNLTVCQYRVLSNSVPTTPSSPGLSDGWRNDAVGTCTGSSATLSIDISVGDGLNCRDNGLDKCQAQFKAEDNAGNSGMGPIVTLDIDYFSPSGGSISYADGFTVSTSVLLTVNDGTDADSGINTLDRVVQRSLAALSNGTCGTYGSFATVSVTGTYPSFTNSGLTSGNCYQYQYLVNDKAGNPATYTSQNAVKVDTAKPEIVSFDVNPKKSAGLWVNAATPNVSIGWHVKDVGANSGLKEVQVWRKKSGESWAQIPESPLTSPSNDWTGSTTDSPSDGSYQYGIHAKDNAGNEITETEAGFSVIDVQVDKTVPNVTINQDTRQADPTTISPINFTVVFSESVTGFTGSDVSFTGSTAGGALAAEVTGPGPTYNVAVTGMTTGGTVRATIPANGATDQAGNLNTASTSIDNTVTWAPNIAPTASDQSVTTNEDTAKAITLTASDPETCELMFAITTNPANGTLNAISSNACASGTPKTDSAGVTYAPNPNWFGTDSFNFTVTDGAGAADTATVTITVTAVNDTPTLNAIPDATMNEDAGAQTANLSGISAGGGESQTLQVAAVSGTPGVIPNPTVTYTSPQATGTLSYTPVANANGNVAITVTVRDAGLDGTLGNADDGTFSRNFTVTVNPVNDAPTISNIANQTINEDSTTGDIAFTVNDVDNPVAELTLTKASSNTPLVPLANIVFGGSGASRTVRVTPAANQNGTATITVTVSDGSLNAQDSFVLTVNAVNDAPVANNDSYSVLEEDIFTVGAPGVLGNDTDIDSSTLTALHVSSPNNGSLTLNADGSFMYDPNVGFNGADSFTYAAHDGNLANNATVTITVSDGTAPTVTLFKVNNKTHPNPPTVNVNASFPVEWGVSESGGSNLKQIEAWRAWDANGDGSLQSSEWNDSSPASGTQANPISTKTTGFDSANQDTDSTSENPSDGTYWYGLHIIDNAGNCITEAATFCPGGVTSDGLTRTVRGPIKVRMQHNGAPNISTVSDSPDPIKANAQITFTVNWNDPDAGDLTKIHVCKTDAFSGQTCSGGSWCDTTTPSSTSPTSCNGTSPASSGTQNYFAFVCDDENACSFSKSGTFLVDATAPTISSWSIAPQDPNWANNAAPNIKVSWSVLDQGGSSLDRVQAFRAVFGAGCTDTDKSACSWSAVGSAVTAPPNSNTWNCTDCVTDAPASGIYWYGIHVVDKAQNETVEPNPPGPKKALVDKLNPIAILKAPPTPSDGSWHKENFSIHLQARDFGGPNDTGTGSTADVKECRYLVNGKELAQKFCNSDLQVTVGANPAENCSTQGTNNPLEGPQFTCLLSAHAIDHTGNATTPEDRPTRLYGIDFTPPDVSKVFVNSVGEPEPILVQEGSSVNYKVKADEQQSSIIGCTLFHRPKPTPSNPNPDFAQGPSISSGLPCERSCALSVDHTLPGAGDWQVRMACLDAALHANAWENTQTDIQVASISVALGAIPSAGSVNTLFDLVATVSGTMTGSINYKFDCTDDGTWEREVNNSTQNPFTAVDLCQYSPPATYTAKVFVQRGAGTNQDTVNITVSSNSIPSATNLSVDPANPTDYCGVTGFPPVRVRWAFSDADPGDTQGAYQIQVFHGGNKVVDTGKKLGATQSYVFQSAGEQLAWNRTYTWQVRVWDSPNDDVSLFASGLQFTTVKHHYPVPNFTWIPALPFAQESVQFTDQTNFAPGSQSKTWSWTFGDGGSSALQNPTHTYTQTGAFGVTLQSTDDVGSCPTQKTVNTSIPFPEWQEISPF